MASSSITVRKRIPETYMKDLPGLFGVTRKEEITILVCAASREAALEKYNSFVSQCPDLEFPQEELDAVSTVQAVK